MTLLRVSLRCRDIFLSFDVDIAGRVLNAMSKGPEFGSHLLGLIRENDGRKRSVLDRMQILRDKSIAETDAGVRRLDKSVISFEASITESNNNFYAWMKRFMIHSLRSSQCLSP